MFCFLGRLSRLKKWDAVTAKLQSLLHQSSVFFRTNIRLSQLLFRFSQSENIETIDLSLCSTVDLLVTRLLLRESVNILRLSMFREREVRSLFTSEDAKRGPSFLEGLLAILVQCSVANLDLLLTQRWIRVFGDGLRNFQSWSTASCLCLQQFIKLFEHARVSGFSEIESYGVKIISVMLVNYSSRVAKETYYHPLGFIVLHNFELFRELS